MISTHAIHHFHFVTFYFQLWAIPNYFPADEIFLSFDFLIQWQLSVYAFGVFHGLYQNVKIMLKLVFCFSSADSSLVCGLYSALTSIFGNIGLNGFGISLITFLWIPALFCGFLILISTCWLWMFTPLYDVIYILSISKPVFHKWSTDVLWKENWRRNRWGMWRRGKTLHVIVTKIWLILVNVLKSFDLIDFVVGQNGDRIQGIR